MALYNTDNNNGKLTALSDDAYAISNPLSPGSGQNDFSYVTNVIGNFFLRDLSKSSSTDTNTLIMEKNYPLGTKILIVKDDESVHEFIVSGAPTIITTNVVPKMTSNTDPEGVASAESSDGNHTPWHAFNRSDDLDDNWLSGTSNAWLQYQFANNVKQRIVEYHLKCSDYNYAPNGWHLQGSNDNSTWTTLATEDNQESSLRNAGLTGITYQIDSPDYYNYYRLTGTDGSKFLISEMELRAEIYSYDVTSITNGEAPTRAYVNNETVTFNGVLPALNRTDFIYKAPYAPFLKATQHYGKATVNSSTIETRINFSETGNYLEELTFDTYNIP